LPLIREGFNLTKREFHGALCLRYGWIPRNIPNECVCGGSFNIDHALSCKTGGFINLRHNELRDITADLLSTVCNDVCKEPSLSNDNDDEELRADVSAGGVWQHMQRAFFDVRVFYPFAPSYRKKFKKEIELSLIFTSNGGMNRETRIFYKRLSNMTKASVKQQPG